MPMNYQQYQEEVCTDVAQVLAAAECQPPFCRLVVQ